MKNNLKLVDHKEHHKENYKPYSDVVNISQCVKLGYIKFYMENNYIYCENTFTKERAIVGTYDK